jgi:hypothetical protein
VRAARRAVRAGGGGRRVRDRRCRLGGRHPDLRRGAPVRLRAGRAAPRRRARRPPAGRVRACDERGLAARAPARGGLAGGRRVPRRPGVRPGARLQPRRRPAVARGEPGAARARSCRHRADPRPRRPHGRSARARLSRVGRTARAGRRAGDRRRDEPGAGADAVRAGDRRRLRPRRRPLHAAGPQRRGGAAPGVPGARRGGDRRRRVQQRRAGRPVGASDVRLPHRAGAGGHARPADRRDLRGPRRPGRGRRDGLPAAPPGAIAGLAPGEQAAVLGETARAFYGLSE